MNRKRQGKGEKREGMNVRHNNIVTHFEPLTIKIT